MGAYPVLLSVTLNVLNGARDYAKCDDLFGPVMKLSTNVGLGFLLSYFRYRVATPPPCAREKGGEIRPILSLVAYLLYCVHLRLSASICGLVFITYAK